MQATARAFRLARLSAGRRRPARTAIMAITTRSSIRVKARWSWTAFCPEFPESLIFMARLSIATAICPVPTVGESQSVHAPLGEVADHGFAVALLRFEVRQNSTITVELSK